MLLRMRRKRELPTKHSQALRSERSERLEGWQPAPCLLPCFETLAALAPQHEVIVVALQKSKELDGKL
jgi:hypothetical protein